MAEVKELKSSYSRRLDSIRQYADGTVTLVKGKKNVIVDTGIPQDKDTILNKVKRRGTLSR